MAIWLLLWHILKMWPGEQWWPVAVVTYFMPWIALGLVPLVGLAWLMHLRILRWMLLLVLLLFTVRLMPLFVKLPAKAQGPELEVMSFNVHQHNRDASAVTAVILAENPDIVALQEVHSLLMADAMQLLQERYPHNTLSFSLQGQVLLSRYPLELLSDQYSYHYQAALVHHPQGTITLLNVHAPTLFPRHWKRNLEQQYRFVKALTDEIAAIEEPLLVVGDFNTTDQSQSYAMLREHLLDAFQTSGWGFGFSYPATRKLGLPLPGPVVRIDYVFYSEHFSACRTWVLKEAGGSDHRPLLSVLCVSESAWEGGYQ